MFYVRKHRPKERCFHLCKRGNNLRKKTDFYRIYFEQLAQRGFQPQKSDSAHYIADIYHKGQLIAYYTKADTIAPCSKTAILMKDKQFSKLFNMIEDTAKATALKAGICTECPYTEDNAPLTYDDCIPGSKTANYCCKGR